MWKTLGGECLSRVKETDNLHIGNKYVTLYMSVEGDKMHYRFIVEYLEGADEYYESLTESEQRKMDNLVYRMATVGEIRNKEKFRIADKKEKIYEFKPQPHRFFCFFFIGARVIITNGYHKKTNKVDSNELKKAIRLKQQFLNEEKAGGK